MNNKWLIRLLCAFIPTRKGRSAFRARHYMQSVFGAAPHLFREVQLKRESLLQQAESIETLFLGSSHVAYGVNPLYYSETSFNLASVSQDLFTSCQLLRRVLPRLPKLRHVFLGYSAFSRGHYVALTRERHVTSSYKYVYGIEYEPPNYCEHFDLECLKLSGYPWPDAAGVRHDRGFLYPLPIPLAGDAETRVQQHMREHNRDISQHGWIEQMAEAVRASGAELHILVPPVRQDYAALLPPREELYAELQQLCGQHGIPLHFFSDADFGEEDFYDFDHLNIQGAKKWTKQIKNLNYD